MSLSFEMFNIFEGIFWLLCGGVAIVARSYADVMPRRFWNLLAINFFLFGLSDFVEAETANSFLAPGNEWLLAWKVLCIVVFLVSIGWYFKVRILK